ncbi:MAG: hypothetical protein VBE63_17205 [Lamprobacter sp.]|uniref:hypothetical protein n=1 Tax=Lamprobacter sp. TaxID=3100796 RepID=UPI002B2599B5|nr:hypothetical protein [Lamprobacter sp.]MEA3641660.1 hypothetical protein [Lamprobacter sp.]
MITINELNRDLISFWRHENIGLIDAANPFQINICMSVGLINYNDISIEKRNQIIKEMSAQDVTYLLSKKLISLSDIPEAKRIDFIKNMNAEYASRLVDHRIIKIHEIPETKRQELVETMTAADAPYLIKSRIIDLSEIPETKRQQLVREVMTEDASRLIWQGIINIDDFTDEKRQELLKNMTPRSASWLVRQGVFKPDEIPNWKRKEILLNMSANEAPWLLQQGVISKTDVSERKKQEIIEKISPKNLQPLIKSGLIGIEEIPEEKRQYLLEKAFNIQAFSFSSLENSEFTSELNAVQDHIDFRLAAEFVSSGILKPQELQNISNKLISQLTPASAQWMVSAGIISSDQIPDDKRKALVEQMNAEQCDWLVHHKVIRPEQIPFHKRQQLLSEIDAYRARWLVGQGVIHPHEIPKEKILEFIDQMNFEDALWLIRQGVLLVNQIPDSRREELAKSAVEDLASVFRSDNEQNMLQSNPGENNQCVDILFGLIDAELVKPADIKKIDVIFLLNQKYLGINRLAMLLSKNFISKSEIPQSKIVELLQTAGAAERRIFAEIGVISDSQTGEVIQEVGLSQEIGQRYTKEEIQEDSRRSIVQQELKDAAWEMVVIHLNPDGSSGFASQPNFAWNIFFLKDRLILEDNIPLRKGDTLTAEVGVTFNRKRNEWNFAIKSGKRILCCQSEVPNWWQAWQFFAPRWEMAAEGRYLLQPDIFNKLQSEGFDTQRLRCWNPTEKDGRRIKLANDLVKIALKEPAEKLPLRKDHLGQQLAGNGVWADLRQLAEAYLDGKKMLSPLNKNPITKSASHADKQKPSNSSQLAKPMAPKAHERRAVSKPLQTNNIKLKPIIPVQVDFSAFITTSTEITIYIDEAWTNQESAIKNSEGVIAGVICKGPPKQQYADLPSVATHSATDESISHQAIKNLLNCSKCIPFIFPIRMVREDQCAQKYYELLLQHAIRLLCGWLMRPEKKTIVSICCERIYQHREGKDGTAFVQGGWLVNPVRFGHWKLASMRWTEKDFGYLPYADLLAYLTHEHTDASRRLGALANYKQLPGYVPFSLELVPRLERLEHLETSANLDDVIEFALETGDSPFGQLVMKDLAKRLAARMDLQQRLLETLEARYRGKARELKQLRRALTAVRTLIPALPQDASPRMRLHWYLLALQDANHDGDPERIRATAGDYLKERQQLKQNDRELCADADLNLAVHYSDRWAFGHAEVTVGEWIYDPHFSVLPPRQQGRFYSALGQYRAMQGDAEGADGFFIKALKLFDEALITKEEREAESDKTKIYRAINAIDGSLRVAPLALEAVFGPLTLTVAEQFAADGSVEREYQHHLLVRALSLRPDLSGVRDTYLGAREQWQMGHAQHPWPSIHGHRAFLLWNHGEPDDHQTDESARAAFDQAIVVAIQDQHGPTVKLIGALWATVAACCYADCDYETNARDLLDQARILPDAEASIATLEAVLTAPDPDRIGEAFSALPFNYR